MKKYLMPLILIASTASSALAADECKAIIDWSNTSQGRVLAQVAEGLKNKGYDVYQKNNSRPAFWEFSKGVVRLSLRWLHNEKGQEIGNPDGAFLVSFKYADRDTFLKEKPSLEFGMDLALSRIGDRAQFEERGRDLEKERNMSFSFPDNEGGWPDREDFVFRSIDQVHVTPLMRTWRSSSSDVCIPKYNSDGCNSLAEHKPVNPNAVQQFLVSIPDCKN